MPGANAKRGWLSYVFLKHVLLPARLRLTTRLKIIFSIDCLPDLVDPLGKPFEKHNFQTDRQTQPGKQQYMLQKSIRKPSPFFMGPGHARMYLKHPLYMYV